MGNADSKEGLREKLDHFIFGSITFDDDVPFEKDDSSLCLFGTEECTFWKTLLSTPITNEDIKNFISPESIRHLRRSQSPKLEIFFSRILNALKSIVDIGTYGQLPKTAPTICLTSVRLLTRVIPLLLECQSITPKTSTIPPKSTSPPRDKSETSPESINVVPPVVSQQAKESYDETKEAEFIDSLFWKTEIRLANVSQNSSNDLNDVKSESPINSDDSIVAIRLLTVLQRLLFIKDLTISNPNAVLNKNETPPKHKVDSRFLWKGGIGAPLELHQTAQLSSLMITTRIEILKCLLSCFSSTLYSTVDEYQLGAPPLWLLVFTRGYIPFTANLFCSLMSTIFSYEPTSYGLNIFSSPTSLHNSLVTLSLQVLCVLVDFNYSTALSDNDSQRSEEQQTNSAGISQMTLNSKSPEDKDLSKKVPSNGVPTIRNAYRLMLAGLKRESDLDFICNGVLRLLNLKMKAGYLSSREFSAHQELLILFWHLLTNNPSFIRRTASRVNSNQFLTPLLTLLLENSTSRRIKSSNESNKDTNGTLINSNQNLDFEQKNDQDKIGLMHLCSFILLLLSSGTLKVVNLFVEREFAVGLNAEYREKFPLPLPAFRGCYADLLVLVSHRVILDSLGATSSDSLIDMLLTILCNVSAYIKTFCLESCVKLLNLLNRFSKPTWLFKASYHYHNLFFLLDLINNAIQYQYEGNISLIYSILRQKDIFLDLQNLTFPKNLSLRDSDNVTSYSDQTDHDESPSAGSDESDLLWKPTESWFLDWKSKMPLHTILRLISCLLPMVETECQNRGLIDQSDVLEFLRKTTMVGLLPVPHAIIIRNYHPNSYTGLWFTTYTWSVIISQSEQFLDLEKIRFLNISRS